MTVRPQTSEFARALFFARENLLSSKLLYIFRMILRESVSALFCIANHTETFAKPVETQGRKAQESTAFCHDSPAANQQDFARAVFLCLCERY